MSGRLADEVFRRQIAPGPARDVLEFYALCAHDDGTEARPTIATVAAVNDLSRRTAQRLIKRWRDLGVLILTQPGRRAVLDQERLRDPRPLEREHDALRPLLSCRRWQQRNPPARARPVNVYSYVWRHPKKPNVVLIITTKTET